MTKLEALDASIPRIVFKARPMWVSWSSRFSSVFVV